MLVLINGLKYFGKKLADDLNYLDADNKYVFIDTYNSFFNKLKFIFLLPFSKLVISFNGVSDKSGILNWVLFFQKKMMMQWHGTDVLLAVERYKTNTIDKKYIDYASHFTDAEWLREELKNFISDVQLLPFKYVQLDQNTIPYSAIAVLTYMGKGKEVFYGLEELIEAANSYPSIDFHVIGTKGNNFNYPTNIIFHGWVESSEVLQMMCKIPIFVRLTKHDGNALSVVEALACGCEVIWSYPGKNSHNAKSALELIEKLSFLKTKIEKRAFLPNEENFNYIQNTYNKKTIINNYIKAIHEIAK
jgi:glycosyltransferase involved in cell wall biosynthesis